MLVNFTKMHGLGNDFIVIDNITQNIKFNSQHFKRLANRRFGVGCDQILLLYPPLCNDTDFLFKIFNSNGKEVEQCGNGARCVAKFFNDVGLTNKTEISMQCRAGILHASIKDNSEVTIDFGIPDPAVSEITNPKLKLPIETLYHLEIGNPHIVCTVNNLENTPVYKWGKELSSLENFPSGINAGFMEVVDTNYIKLRVFERGAGLTPACGSGALAATVVGRKLGLLENETTVEFINGKLLIYLNEKNNLCMTGATFSAYHGCFRI